MAKIAFCTNANPFLRNEIFKKGVAEKYPGALWVSRFSEMAEREGHEIVTGDVALEKIETGIWSSNEILVIQEDCALDAEKLLALGAIPSILICLESPIFAEKFYKNLSNSSKIFKNLFLFRGAQSLIPKKQRYKWREITFPAFATNEIRYDARSWDSKKFAIMVCGNKYWMTPPPSFENESLKGWIVRWLKYYFIRSFNIFDKYQRLIKKSQLHDLRINLIYGFGTDHALDLWGPSWGQLTNLPMKLRRKIASIIELLNPVPCDDKLALISEYKFNLCTENMAFSGYVTEKIIDAIRVGVIPVYCGAEDIDEFVPRSAFIDIRQYKSLDELKKYLSTMSEQAAENYLQSGRQFLASEKGRKFTYEYCAYEVMAAIRRSIPA